MSRRIADPRALAALREQARAGLALRDEAAELRVTVHMGTCGIAAGARDVLGWLLAELGAAATGRVTLRQAGCAGLCAEEPMITVTDRAGRELRYGRLDEARTRAIVARHLLGGEPVADLLLGG